MEEEEEECYISKACYCKHIHTQSMKGGASVVGEEQPINVLYKQGSTVLICGRALNVGGRHTFKGGVA